MTILFYGDSLTAGFGLSDSATQSYPALIGEKIKSANLNYEVINAGLSGDTSQGGLSSPHNIALVPFFLKGVLGVRNLNLADGLHPSKEGYKIIAQTVWPVLRPLL